jgi:hypothetical protein
MQVPWFFATTPAPRLAVRLPVRRTPWWSRLAARYIAWAERSHDSLRGRAAGR